MGRRIAMLRGKADLGNIKQVLDIGSWHLGQSLEFAELFPDARVDAFEPVPASYELCKSRHEALPPQQQDRIRVHNVAISDKSGTIPFYAVDPAKSSVPNVGASSMFRFMDGMNGTPFNQRLVQQQIEVTATTLDNWCTNNNITAIDIMWVDVQGAELLVFKGAENILRNTRIIMTEVGLKPYYEGHTLKADIDAYLKQHNFRELHETFELNGFDYEANTIYINQALPL